MKTNMWLRGVVLVALAACSGAVEANPQPYAVWLQQLKAEAIASGVQPHVVDAAFKGAQSPNETVLRLDRKQPEGSITFPEYRERVVSAVRIKEGKALLQKHRALLREIAAKYQVQPRFIVALWGIETSYGKVTGGFDSIEALATLAYDGRRSEFFRGELMDALKIYNSGDIALGQMKGSWAGALGQSQFMPSSFHSFAVDYDGDKHRDIWNTQSDVFASIANYLHRSGWSGEQTWGRAVRAPATLPESQMSREVKKALAEWQALGVRNVDGSALPNRLDLLASVVRPDGSPHAYLVYGNYDVIMKWNRSLYFATSVGLLSDALAGAE